MNIKINSLKSRRGLFLAFAFAMTATLSFLAIYNMAKTNAASFNAGDIMSDAVMANYNSMSEADINNFMHSKNSCNDTNLSKRNRYPNLTYQIRDGHFVCLADQTFNGQSAAHIIWQAAQDYKINPQVLLVLLQKEQSLITDTWPDDQQIRKATGFACTDSAPCDQSKSGFENQIRKAANLYRTVLDGGWSNYPVGNNYVQYNPNTGCGGSTIYIANRATSSLYRYTPYQPNAAALNGGGDSCSAYGNLNFWKYFTNWFGDTHAISDINSVYMPEGTYILNTTAGKALGFSGTSNGTAAKVVDSNNSDTSQQFTLERDDYQYFKLRNVASGRYLDVAGASTDNEAVVQLYDGNDTCAQRWSIEIVDASAYRLRSACSYKALDVSGAGIDALGTKIQIYTNNNTKAQQWVIKNISSAPLNNGTYTISTTGTKVMALFNEETVNGTKIVNGETHSASTERFQVSRTNDGFYKIQNVAANKSLDITGGGTSNGTLVQIYNNNNTCAQRWIIKAQSNDTYNISSACSGKFIDVDNAKTDNENTKIQIWDQTNSNAQLWKFNTPLGQTVDDGIYTINTKINQDYYLDIDSGSWAKNGLNAQIWSRNNSNNAQKFQISYDETTGYYTIKNVFSNRNLDVSGATKAAGGNIQVWNSNSTCAQRWMFTSTNNGGYNRILSACSRKAIDLNNGLAKNGTNIQIWEVNNSSAQQWHLAATTIKQQDSILENTNYLIQSATNNAYSLDAVNANNSNGTNIQIWETNKSAAQRWQFKRTTDGYYQIVNTSISKPIDVAGGDIMNGANVQIWQTNNTCAQKWSLSPMGNNYYTIKSACSDKVLDLSGGKAKNGTNVQIYNNNETSAQKWRLVKL